ncbi:MAG: aminotransferase class V-fold PLP-dependent enzyme [candidate division WOR-3 bacterium]
MMLEQYRELFPITQNYIYLNHAATGPLPIPTVAAIAELAHRYSEEGNLEWSYCEKLADAVRQFAAKLVNAAKDEIAFVQNTSQGIIIAIGSISWQSGDNLILMKDGFPTNLYPYHYLLPQVEKRYVTSYEILADPYSILKHIDKKTKAVALDWVNFLNGIKIDIATIGEICRNKGIYFIIDGMQGLGAVTIDLSKVKVDFFSAAAPKWLLGPEGIGILYVRKEILNCLQPTNLGWLSADWPDFYDIYTQKPLKTTTARFEAGTKNYLGITGLGESLKLFHNIGLANIETKIYHLTDYLLFEISDSRFEILTPRERNNRAGIVSFRHKDKDTQELFMKLRQNKIVCSLREGYIRISPHFYNTEQEMETLIRIINS